MKAWPWGNESEHCLWSVLMQISSAFQMCDESRSIVSTRVGRFFLVFIAWWECVQRLI